MPTYVYRRDDGTTFELQQRITEDALTTCPTTGQGVARVPVRGAGFVLKGTGFYQTDYKPAPSEPASSEPASAPAPSAAPASSDAPAAPSAAGGD